MLDGAAGTNGPDYVITTVDDPQAARAEVRDGAFGAAAGERAKDEQNAQAAARGFRLVHNGRR